MPAEHHPKLSVRFNPDGYRQLRALAAARGISLSRCLRQLVDEASPDAAPKPASAPERGDLLDLLRERAQDGNVSAIRALLEIERQRDPRQGALAALERVVEARRQ